MKKYPVIHPNIHLNDLNENTCVLTNCKNMKTKKLNKYQKAIIKACNGTNSIDDIKLLTISENNMPSSVANQVEEYIEKLIGWGYLSWSPQRIEGLGTGLVYLKEDANHKKGIAEYEPSSLLSITVSILDSCCLKCGYCSQNAPVGKSKQYSFEKIKEILDDAYELGAKYFGIFGGEPMLHHNIFEIIQYAYAKGFKTVYLYTRGTLITEDVAKKLRSVGIHFLQLTVDSHIPEKYDATVGVPGSFDKMYKAIYYLQSLDIDILLKTIVTTENIGDIVDLVKYFRELGVEKFDFEVVVPVGRADFSMVPSKEQIDDLRVKLAEISKEYQLKSCGLSAQQYGHVKQCSGGIGSIFVFADGVTAPCDKSYFVRDQLTFGNVNEKSLKDIWRDGPHDFRKLRNNDERCSSCGKASSCLGGCILNSYIQEEKFGPDPTCPKISGKTQGIFPID